MKNIIITFFVLAFAACGKQKQTEVSQVELPGYVIDVALLNQESMPIETFMKYANSYAVFKESLNKKNVKALLDKAKETKYNFVLVGNHTVVKITNLSDCKSSRAWGSCMPKGEGFIKKGDLIYKNDYINNIIGLPDNQNRVLYGFN